MENCECGALHRWTIPDMSPAFVGVLGHFSSRQTIFRLLLMAQCIVEQPQASDEALCFQFKYVNCVKIQISPRNMSKK